MRPGTAGFGKGQSPIYLKLLALSSSQKSCAQSTNPQIHKGQEHVVTVQDVGFEYGGEHFTSLSKVAHAITGTPWNGFVFFGLQKRTAKKSAEQEA